MSWSATNNSTSAPVTWANDHITKTTTYTFANGATNPVVTTVAGTVSTPTLGNSAITSALRAHLPARSGVDVATHSAFAPGLPMLGL